jgi:hypothetical protein
MGRVSLRSAKERRPAIIVLGWVIIVPYHTNDTDQTKPQA